MDNQQFHNVTVTRAERELEIIIDDLYVNRTTSPGSELTLDIDAAAIYLGAGYNGTATNGFIGCVTGFIIDRKDVPFSSDSIDFSILTNFEGISGGCPIGSISETPRADEQVFPAIVGIILGLLLISVLFVAICVIGQWYRNRRSGEQRLGDLRRNSTRSRRSWHFRETSNSSPMQDAFQWQAHSAPAYKEDMSIPPGIYRSTPEHVPIPSVPDTTFNHNMNNRNASPEHATHPTEFAETGFNAPSLRSSSKKIRSHRIPQPAEGFAFSQSNQSYRDDIDSGRPREAVQPKFARTMSGHQSILSASTIGTTSLQDDAEVVDYLRKRTNIANNEIVQLNFDELLHYKEEGPYQPLGSMESLLEFVNELDVPQFEQEKKRLYQFPADTPVASRQGTLAPPTSHVPVAQRECTQAPPISHVPVAKREHTQAPPTSHVPVAQRERTQASPTNHVSVAKRERTQAPPTNHIPVAQRERTQASPTNHIPVAKRESTQVPPTNHIPVAQRERTQASPTNHIPVAKRESTQVPPTSHVPIVYQVHNPSPTKTEEPKTSPLTGQRFNGEAEVKVRDPHPNMERGKGRSKAARKSGRQTHKKKMENILDRFHDITTGHIPDEGRLI